MMTRLVQALLLIICLLAVTSPVGAAAPGHTCGHGSEAIDTSIAIGCEGKGNAILDMLFAFIRFLSAGAGLFIIGSLVLGGIQYTISRSDPQATAAALNRIRSVLVALLIYIFAYAILNYLIPGKLLQ